MAIVEVDQLTVRHGDLTAVDQISFQAAEAEITVILGPNGAGKTSTIECLEGFSRPHSGHVRVCGLDPATERAALNRQVGIMLQGGGMYSAIRPREALRLYASFYDRPRDPDQLLDFVGLTDRASAKWANLSGGEQQRLSLALSIIGRPRLVFLDEPTAGVDIAGKQLIRKLIESLRADGVTVVMTTHDLAEVEALAQRIIIIDAGHVVADDTPERLLSGRDTAEFTFRAARDLDVTALESVISREVDGTTVSETEPGRYLVTAPPTPRLVAALTAWLAERDILVDDLQAGRRELEAVFLKLTEPAEPTRQGEPTRHGETTGPVEP